MFSSLGKHTQRKDNPPHRKDVIVQRFQNNSISRSSLVWNLSCAHSAVKISALQFFSPLVVVQPLGLCCRGCGSGLLSCWNECGASAQSLIQRESRLGDWSTVSHQNTGSLGSWKRFFPRLLSLPGVLVVHFRMREDSSALRNLQYYRDILELCLTTVLWCCFCTPGLVFNSDALAVHSYIERCVFTSQIQSAKSSQTWSSEHKGPQRSR